MRGLDLITAGDAFEDLVFVGLPRLPKAGEELKSRTFVRTVGGGAVITAAAAARLGLRCAVLTAAGDDAARRLKKERVRLINLRRHGEPSAVTASLSTPRDRSFVTFIGVNDELEKRLRRALARVSARHVHLALQPAHCRSWIPIVNALRARGISTSWDFGWSDALARDRSFAKLAAALDFLFVNAQEARLYGVFRGAAGHATIVKLGRRGARWVGRETRVTMPAPRVRAVDTTGAGDAFNGGFLFALLRNMSPRDCLRIGNAVGASSTRAAGGLDALPRLSDIA